METAANEGHFPIGTWRRERRSNGDHLADSGKCSWIDIYESRMISEAEIRRSAARWQVDPMIPDLNYALGWFLAGFSYIQNAPNALRFKGGTCLRKCYFPGYRFSEDLDFSATRLISPSKINDWVARIASWSADRTGPDFLAAPFRVEVVEDEYGKDSSKFGFIIVGLCTGADLLFPSG